MGLYIPDTPPAKEKSKSTDKAKAAGGERKGAKVKGAIA
jgi:hypothetical protein